MSKTRKVSICRGLPGSGKTTWALNQVAGDPFKVTKVLSADNCLGLYVDGVYQPHMRAQSHLWCKKTFKIWLETPFTLDHIIVANTNLTAWEISYYYQLTEVMDYEVEIVEFVCDPEVAFARQEHGVPRGTFDRMINTMFNENLPPWWKRVTVVTDA